MPFVSPGFTKSEIIDVGILYVGWTRISVNGIRRAGVTHDGRRRFDDDIFALLLITIVIGVRRYWRAASRRPISNFSRRDRKISLSRTIIPIFPRDTTRDACPPADYIPENIFRNPQRDIRASVEPSPTPSEGSELAVSRATNYYYEDSHVSQ